MAYLDPADHRLWKAELTAGPRRSDVRAAVGRTARRHPCRDRRRCRRSPRCSRPTRSSCAAARALSARHGARATRPRRQRWRSRRQTAATTARAGPRRRQSEEHSGRAGTARCSSTPNAPGTAIRPSTSPSASTICSSSASRSPAARLPLPRRLRRLAGAYLARCRLGAAGRARGARRVAAARLLLARVDGKSPVEYLTGEADKDRVRRVAVPLIVAAPSRRSRECATPGAGDRPVTRDASLRARPPRLGFARPADRRGRGDARGGAVGRAIAPAGASTGSRRGARPARRRRSASAATASPAPSPRSTARSPGAGRPRRRRSGASIDA